MATRPRGKESRPITLQALADYLQLHPATVSVVLNDIPGRAVPEHTRIRIKEAATLFDYKPNALARSLRTGRTRSIGVVLPELSNLAYASIMTGVGNHLTQNGYSYMALHHGYSPDTALQDIELLSTRGAEGLILIDAVLDKSPAIPTIAIGCRGCLDGIARIEFDQHRAAALALECFVSRGQRKVHMLNRHDGGREDSLAAVVRETAEFFHIELVDGMSLPDKRSANQLDCSDQTCYAGALSERGIAILTFSIQDANGAATAAREQARTVGSQCFVLCIDREGTEFPSPGIAVVRTPHNAVGQLSADAILRWVRSHEDLADRVLTADPELVSNSSMMGKDICT